jgi:hypothetical protein
MAYEILAVYVVGMQAERPKSPVLSRFSQRLSNAGGIPGLIFGRRRAMVYRHLILTITIYYAGEQ